MKILKDYCSSKIKNSDLELKHFIIQYSLLYFYNGHSIMTNDIL